MRRSILCALLFLLVFPCALADEAPARDITKACALTLSSGSRYAAYITDGRITTRWKAANRGESWLEIAAPAGEAIGGVYLQFNETPAPWRAEVFDADAWRPVYESGFPALHDTVRLETPAQRLRIISRDAKENLLGVAELTVYGPGALPDTAQHWEPTHDKADILFLAAHADDELIFFGGAIPTYDAQRGCRVVVAYLVNCGWQRHHELLDGLWSMGVRNYPVISSFRDKATRDMETAYSAMGGAKKVRVWVTALFRQYRPEVVVTHGLGGEYGHGQHKAAANAAVRAFTRAADPAFDKPSSQKYGVWQVKKLYLHQYPDGSITMDWSRPLSALDGATGLEAAVRAFTFHVSQHEGAMDVTHTGAQYDNTAFGLYATVVGPDAAGGDFMENIDVGAP